MNSKFVIVAALLCIGQFCQAALDPSAPPSDNFDLTTWKVTLPDQTEEDVASLLAGFESPDEFYTDPISGAMVFVCPNDGETGGSTYPRSELREMLRGTTTSIGTTGFTLNNWVFSTASQSHKDDTAGVDGTMTAVVAVDHVSTTGTDYMIGRVIIGQIHASGDEPCRLYYRKLPGNSKGSIYMAHEPTDATGLPEQWYDMIGSRSNTASDPADGIALGEPFSYKIEAVGSDLNVTIMRDGKPDVTQYVDMTSTGHLDDWMYFKAGCYNQNNSGDAGEYAQVSFYALTKAHTISGNSSPAFSADPINEINANAGVVYNSSIADNASDPDSDPMTFSKLSGPAWLNVAPDGTLSGTPDSGDVGVNEFTVQVLATGGLVTAKLNITVDAAPVYTAPYDIPRFQAAIAECKLQAPDSSTRATQAELIAGFNNSEFYVADTDKMAFWQTGSGARTELRYLNNWYVNSGNRTAHANLKVESQTCDQVTILQIHDDANVGAGPNAPLLRIYKHTTKTPVNHIWAAYKTDATGDNTTHVDLGAAPTGYFDCDITISGGNLLVAVDGVTYVNTDVSFWTFPSYWKAGAYLQDAGEATVYFNELTWLSTLPPACSITSPTEGATFTEGDNVTINADASDSDGTVTKVEFYQGTTKLGEDTTSPYSYTWNDVPDGSYSLTAKATDNDAAETTSTAVGITVIPGPNDPPTCSITSPAEGATFTAGNNVTINADASDSDGTVDKVEFFQGTTKLGEDTTAPYSYTWNNVPEGSYSLTAKATDNDAAETTSTAVGITVNPSVILTSEDFESGFGEWVNVGGDTDDWRRDSGGTSSSSTGPSTGANGSTWYVYLECSSGYAENPGDHAFLEGPELTTGTDRVLSFYYHMYGNQMGTLNVDVYSGGSWTEGVWSRSGQQHTSSSEAYTKATVDLSAFSGTIRIRFRGVATGDIRGDMAIDDIEVRRSIDPPNQPPICSITSPADGANYTEGDNVTITADASDSDGTVTKVEFYEGVNLLGEDTTAPYSFTWNSVLQGSYSLTAKATDDDDAATTSMAVGISVDEVPVLAITLDGTNVVLSWPTAGSSGFGLESTTNLTVPAWSPAGTPTVIGDVNYATNSPSVNDEFYRLHRP